MMANAQILGIPQSWPERSCPACDWGQAASTTIHRQQFTLPDGCLLPTAYDLIFCNMCGCSFADVRSQAVYDHYYREFDVYQHVDKAAKVEADAKLLLDRYGPRASFFDYGCGNGKLAQKLREGGAEVGWYDHATRQTVGDFPFAVSLCMHVLEHVVAPITIMRKLVGAAPEVYVEVPDSSRYTDDVLQDINAEHINHFTSESLARLFGRAGLEVTYVDRAWADIGTTCGGRFPVLRMAGQRSSSCGAFASPMCDYIQRGTLRLAAIYDQLAAVPRFSIWGCGQLAWKILRMIRPEQVAGLADSSPAVQGRRFGKFGAVVAPAALPRDVPVLACSAAGDGIEREARAMGMEVIRLADGLCNRAA